MTPPDTPSLVERLRDANAHIEIQAAQIAALQSTNDHLHEGLAANAKEMADVVGEVERARDCVLAIQAMAKLRAFRQNPHELNPDDWISRERDLAAEADALLAEATRPALRRRPMVAFNFTVFTDKVAAREKRMTIRKTARAKPGDRIQLYTGMRTKACRKLVEDAVCEAVVEVTITESGMSTRVGSFKTLSSVVTELTDLDGAAQRDGFQDWPAMRDWFADKYGLPFTGYAHLWHWPEESPNA